MKKIELLKMMSQEQLLKIVQRQDLEIESLEIAKQANKNLIDSKNEEIRSLEAKLSKSEFRRRGHKRTSDSRLGTLRSIADQFNRSNGATKVDEIINLKAQSNILDRVHDIFEMDENKNFIIK